MLTFNLKFKYFDMIISGLKDTEYRTKNNYWDKRISKLKIGDTIKIIKGHTKTFIYAEVVKIDKIIYTELPEYAKEFFYDLDRGFIDNMPDFLLWYYAIQFKIIKEEK